MLGSSSRLLLLIAVKPSGIQLFVDPESMVHVSILSTRDVELELFFLFTFLEYLVSTSPTHQASESSSDSLLSSSSLMFADLALPRRFFCFFVGGPVVPFFL